MIPCIAIIEDNTLSAMALQGILEDLFPTSEILRYTDMESFNADCNRHFFHFFIGRDILLANASDFDMLKKETIVTSVGPCPSISESGYKVLDITLAETSLIKEIILLHENSTLSTPSEQIADILSDREKEVLRGIVMGKLNKEIADELNISTTTAIFHRNNICSKLGTRAIGKLTIQAILSGIVNLNEL